jgi:hypothetical protein
MGENVPIPTVVNLTISIRQDKDGGIQSRHDFQARQDIETALAWPNCGVQQIAFALLIEALKQELFVDVLVKQTREDLLGAWQTGSEDAKLALEGQLCEVALGVMAKTGAKLAPELAKGILAAMTTGLAGK